MLATILALVMALSLCSVSWADAALAKGADGKFHITSADDLKTFAKMVNEGTEFSGETVVLDGPITLTEDNWTPIGNDRAKPFKGTFDGQNYAISGLKITSVSYIGLFGYVGAGARIENVKLTGAEVSGTERVGALIGCIIGGAAVSNCSVDSSSKVTGSGSNTGGLIGEAIGNITVTLDHLTNYAAVKNTANANSRAAGIIAQMTKEINVTITNCVNEGTVEANTSGGYAGGIAAALQGGHSMVSFSNCSNTGRLTGQYTGNLLGWVVDGSSVSAANSGSARDAIGAVNAKASLSFPFKIDNKDYFVKVLKNEKSPNKAFSELWDAKGTIDGKYMDRIIDFFNYARTQNNNFVNDNYPTTRFVLFQRGESESFFGGEGWPELLAGYNTKANDNMTVKDFEKTWTTDVLYAVVDPAPTPSTGGYYYYQPTTDTKADDAKGSPKTFDAGIGIYAVTAVLSVTGMAWTAKKRH